MQKTKVTDSMARTRIRDWVGEYLVAYRLYRHFKRKSIVSSFMHGLDMIRLCVIEEIEIRRTAK